MLWASIRNASWRGLSLVAITYVYFLIFAQFAFIKHLGQLGISDTHLKAVMSAMACGGILLSLLAPRLTLWSSPVLRLRVALAACALAAILATLRVGVAGSIGISFLIGGGLGLLTVTLVTYLRLWLTGRNPLLQVGLGTGIGYFICNLPPLFTASPEAQAITSALLCLAGIFINPVRTGSQPQQAEVTSARIVPFLQVVTSFTALVWLDSAAFFIIQNTPQLKAGTWDGTAHLWTNALIHFSAALLSVWLLRRRGLSTVLILAFTAFACACILLMDSKGVLAASLFYPAGVSLYSVALVAYPSLLSSASSSAMRGQQAGWIYAIAGWFGSAMGIGMGQHLGYVPFSFLAISGAVIFTPKLMRTFRLRRREVAAAAIILLSALCIERVLASLSAPGHRLSAIEKGQQVYMAEGCIACHSQYVRPNTSDVIMWGPTRSIAEVRRDHPPLIGNRRQGPDLSEVGGRRSTLWLEAHFYNPADVSYQSIMPSYAYLFRDSRGNDLIAYLRSLRSSGFDAHVSAESTWHLPQAAASASEFSRGAPLFQDYCSTCHAGDGRTRQRWHAAFMRLPPNLSTGPFQHVQAAQSLAQREQQLARIIKFGIPGTDMPGHEYLSDKNITSLSAWLTKIIPLTSSNKQNPGQENK